MFLKNSRYLASARFAPAADGSVPFAGVRPREVGAATPVVEHALQPGERLDRLGGHFYNETRLWWRIVDANADVLCAAEIELLGLAPLPDPAAPPPTAEEAQQARAALQQEFGEVLLVPRAKE